MQQVSLARRVPERRDDGNGDGAFVFTQCALWDGDCAKMADNREEISELVEKRGICRRVAPLTHRDRVAPWTPRCRAVRRAPQDGDPSPRHVVSSMHARPRPHVGHPWATPRAEDHPLDDRARALSPISTGCTALRDVIRETRDSTVTAVIVAVTFIFLAARLSDVTRSACV